VRATKRYEVFLEEAEEGGSVVACPALPRWVSEGDSREHALANIRNAIKGYLATLPRYGQRLPTVEVEVVEVAA